MNESKQKLADQPSGSRNKPPQLGLQIPQQTAPEPGSFLLDARQTDAWFEALPMANIGETARRVYGALIAFNRTEIPDSLRAKSVEKFRPSVEYITANLQKYYVDAGLPLSPKGAKTAALACELQKELANSYKIVVERMLSGANSQFDRRLLVIALHRTLYYLGETLLQNALVYAAWPSGVWREINSIYSYASQNQIHQIPVKLEDGRNTLSNTIEEQFKAMMLFASATPHRLRQSHARLLHAHLSDWVPFTNILDEDDGGTSLGRFNVDLTSDSAPMHNALRTPAPGKGVAILDARVLLKKLRGDFENAPWDSRPTPQSGKQELTRPVLRLLIMAWSRPPDRRFVRTRLNFDLRVVAGLHAIYGNLLAEDDPPFSTNRAAVFHLEDTDSRPSHKQLHINWTSGSLENASVRPMDADIDTDSLLHESQFVMAHAINPARPLNDFAEKPKPIPEPDDCADNRHSVKTINESAGGYCIRWDGENIPRVKIGELIGLESPTDRRRYGLGVVRWMKQQQNAALHLGIEVISTRCEAADVRESVGGNPRNRPPSYKCLIINDTDPSTSGAASLVMSAMTLQTGVDLTLSIGGREQQIRLTKLVEFSSAFARYLFDFVEAAEKPADSETSQADQFNDLWNNL